MTATISLVAALTALVAAIGTMLGTVLAILKMWKELEVNTQLTTHGVMTGESTHRILTGETEASAGEGP